VSTPVEVSGISVVGAGSFNPAIFQPRWLDEKELISGDAADAALEQLIVTPQMTAYTADWLSVQVTLQKAQFSTVEAARESDLRDLARGVFDLLPETPVDAVGLNADTHFRVGSEDEWHTLGDRFLPKDFWSPLFEGEAWRKRADGTPVGLRTMTVEAYPEGVTGHVRVEVAPSVRVVPHGVYIGINAHFQLPQEGDVRSNAFTAARTIDEHWEATRALERQLIERILEAA
jgi:hypothetical protein